MPEHTVLHEFDEELQTEDQSSATDVETKTVTDDTDDENYDYDIRIDYFPDILFPELWNQSKNYLTGSLNITANVTAQNVTLYAGDSAQPFAEVQPSLSDTDCMIYWGQDSLTEIINSEGGLNLEALSLDPRLGSVILVEPETASLAHVEERFDFLPATNHVRLYNTTQRPISVRIAYDGSEPELINPSMALPPTVKYEDGLFQLNHMPPAQDGVVYLCDLALAAVAHAAGRFDFVAVGVAPSVDILDSQHFCNILEHLEQLEELAGLEDEDEDEDED